MMPSWVPLLMSGFGVFLAGQGIVLIWNLSRINTTLVFIKSDIDRAILDFEKRDSKRENEIAAIWKRIDESRERLALLESRA